MLDYEMASVLIRSWCTTVLIGSNDNGIISARYPVMRLTEVKNNVISYMDKEVPCIDVVLKSFANVRGKIEEL